MDNIHKVGRFDKIRIQSMEEERKEMTSGWVNVNQRKNGDTV